MRGTLDPTTLAKIDAFARRRKRLILVRGLCAVLTILLAAMTTLSIVDYFVLLPDELRWGLSVAAYGAALFFAWFTCARLLWNAPDARILARFIEQLRPELREDLLSAVELGDPRGREQWESEEFREILQQTVAERVRSVQVESLLSFKRVARWGYAAMGILGLCLGLLLVPGLRYDNLLLRSLLPGANLERISRVKVTVLEPSPPETVVPQGDIVSLRVEVSDADVPVAFLETFAPGKKPEKSEMKAAGKGFFEAGISVGREPLSYRVRAADAMTRKYTLTPVARPEAITFHKTYHYPDYAEKSPETEVTKEKGDLITLEGTVVDLKIEVNQDVEQGNLQIEQAGKSTVVRLEPSGTQFLSARVPVTASGTYKIFLKARETRFENKFSPQYEIRSMPDLIPRVTLEDPVQDLILPPDEVITVKGIAKDDLGLRKVIQVVRLNQGDWKETLLAEKPGPAYAVSHRWDLFEMRVQPGDRVTTKLLAIDLKGNRAESQPVHITISAPGFDPQRLVPLAAKEEVYRALVELRDAARDVEKKVAEAAARPATDELARTQALINAASDAEKVAQQAEATEARAKEALRLSRGGREAVDLVLVARLVRRLKEDLVASARADIERAESPAALQRAADSLRRAAEQATGAEESFRALLVTEESIAILNDLKDLSRDEAAIHRQVASAQAAKDPKVWERLARRQGVAVSQAASLDEVLQVLVLHAPEGYNKRAAAIRNQLKATREALEKALAGGGDAKLHGPSQAMQRDVDGSLAQMHALELELGRRAQQQREALAKRSEPSFADVSSLMGEMGAASDAEKKLAASGTKTDLERRAAREAGGRAVDRWKGVRVQLEARASVEESRKDQDAFFVADSALAGRALQAVLEVHSARPDPAASKETLQIVERAYRTLETGHALAELASALRELAEGERWGGSSPNLASRHPKDWAWVETRARELPEAFKTAGLPPEPLVELQKSWRGPAGDAARREMNERIAFGRRPGGVAVPFERLGADSAKALAAIQPAMEAARRELQKLVPSLAERLEKLTEAAREIQKKTDALAKEAPKAEAAQTRAEARSRLETQQNIDKQIDQVMTDLRRDANLQNLFTEQGREKARDADDAVAMLRQSPPKAEDLLAQAASSPQPQAQEQTLTKAAEQQGKLADALKTLAEHYKNAEKGKPEETRPELRKAEEALGLKPQLDKQYAEMAKLAELAQQPNEALKSALQSEASQNEALQRQLEQLSQNALDRAEQALQQAAQMEQQTQQNRSLADQARKIADEARKMARQDVPALAKEAQKAQAPAAEKPLAQAAQDLEKAAANVPQDLSKPQQAAQGLENAAKDLTQAAQDLQQAQAAEQQAAQAAQQKAQAEQQQAAAAQQQAAASQQQAQKQAQTAQQAQQSAQQAKAAAKQAQDAAAQQPQNADAQKAAQQAQQAAQQADQSAKQAQDMAAKSAQQAQQAQANAQKEAGEATQAQAAEQTAKAAAEHTGKEAAQAQALAQQAQNLANAAKQQGQMAQNQGQQGAQQQAQIGEMVQQAANDIQQAAKNEQAIGNPEQAQTLEQVAQATQGVAQNEVMAAQKAAQGPNSQAAQQAEQKAAEAIQAQASALAQARAAAASPQQGPPDGQPAEASGLSEAASQLLAQALNALNGQQGQQPAPPGQGQQGQAQQAVQSAAQAQAQSMAQGRSQGQQGQGQPGQPGQPATQPGQMPFSQTPGSGKGASVESGRLAEGQLPPGALLKPGEWGKLPPRLARDLMEAQRESVSGEYRNMVETYFKVIAERAKEKK
jgi:hypothetical protein